MAVLLDTGIVCAYYDRSDVWHTRARAVIRNEAGGLIVPALVVPAVDHLLGQRLGPKARHVFYQGLVDGDYDVVDLPHDQYPRVVEIDRQFADLTIGFVDAAVLVLAGRPHRHPAHRDQRPPAFRAAGCHTVARARP